MPARCVTNLGKLGVGLANLRTDEARKVPLSLSQKHINFARNSVFGAAVVKRRRIVGDFVISSKDLTQPHPNTPGIMQSAARVGVIKLIWQCAVSLSPANLMSSPSIPPARRLCFVCVKSRFKPA